MDGLLIVDKPSGPTSHDIVARTRRVLRERRIGHTGTLDPMASGVLPLVVGRATRLARFLPGDKAYEAVVRLGFCTDTCDALGTPSTAPYAGAWPDPGTIEKALAPFRGTFLQQPPAFSAKKVAGERSYAVARRAARAVAAGQAAADPPPQALPRPSAVTVHQLDLVSTTGDLITLRVRCSAGFYVRSLACDLGIALGTGGHLAALRRVEAAGAGLDRAVPFEVLEGPGGGETAAAALIALDDMLPALAPVTLTEDGVNRARVGRTIGPGDAVRGFATALATAGSAPVRLVTLSGRLVGIADDAAGAGLLHPSVVLM